MRKFLLSPFCLFAVIEKCYPISPYAYCARNPINATDPTGMSTKVRLIEDGVYEVIGGEFDDDKNIYVYEQDENGEYTIRGKSIGVTTSITTFYDSDNGQWKINSIINESDDSGKNFLSGITENPPPLYEYMKNARKNHKYDFKATNGTDQPIPNIDPYRGMPIGTNSERKTVYSSARDIGNMVAGYMAAINNVKLSVALSAFNAYQSYQDQKFSIEGISTRNAEVLGWKYGHYSTSLFER